MIGLVVVSHSRALADAAVALAAEMLQGRPVPIAVAAGLDEHTFGTDAVAIADAIGEADQGDGVVVLMDLGSAVLSAELALELLPDDEARARVTLCAAPLVEGLVVAAVTARSGAGRAEVAAEAAHALAAKQSQLAPPPETPPRDLAPERTEVGGSATGRFTVTAAHGLHARPAARLVQLLQGFAADVELRNVTTGSPWVPGASLSRVATLAAGHGHDVEARATGAQAQEAVDAVVALARRDFGATPAPAPAPAPATVTSSAGPYAAAPGIGIGPALLLDRAGEGPDPADVPRAASDDPRAEPARLAAALEAAGDEIAALRRRVARTAGEDDAAIFDAHRALLADPDLLSAARTRIDEGWTAASAWAAAATGAAAALAALPDEYLRARAADVRAVATQVLAQLLPAARASSSGERTRSGPPAVLIADDLTPARAATLDPARIAGIALAGGSPTAHSAILVRGLGIPAVVGAGADILDVAPGTTVVVDGTAGAVVVAPAPGALAGYEDRRRQAQERQGEAQARAAAPAATADGTEIRVGANIGSRDGAVAARAAGADYVGLVRTEFLFLDRDTAPDVDEQEAAYRELAGALPGLRLTLRTLDVGGDKPLPYLPAPVEANPFLGVRGIRLALSRPALLADQLLAMVRLAHDAPVGIMFPMVATLAELVAARQAVEEAVARDGRPRPAGLEIGIMVEVPAAALKAATFAPHVDFFSIGTNDLTQYTLAAERGNDALAALGDPLDPAVLRLVDLTCRAAADAGARADRYAGVPDHEKGNAGTGGPTVAVCGELAADERAAAVLVGLGVRELSVSPAAIPTVKQAVRALTRTDAEHVAAQALQAPSAEAVRALLG